MAVHVFNPKVGRWIVCSDNRKISIRLIINTPSGEKQEILQSLCFLNVPSMLMQNLVSAYVSFLFKVLWVYVRACVCKHEWMLSCALSAAEFESLWVKSTSLPLLNMFLGWLCNVYSQVLSYGNVFPWYNCPGLLGIKNKLWLCLFSSLCIPFHKFMSDIISIHVIVFMCVSILGSPNMGYMKILSIVLSCFCVCFFYHQYFAFASGKITYISYWKFARHKQCTHTLIRESMSFQWY